MTPTCESLPPDPVNCPGYPDSICSGNGVCDTIAGTCTCNDGWGGDECELEIAYTLCSGGIILDDLEGGLWSNYDPPQATYENFMCCSWVFFPDVNPARVYDIRLKFSEFEVENGYDYLYISDGLDFDFLGESISCSSADLPEGSTAYTGSSVPADYISETGQMTVVFASDYSVYQGGFVASFTVELKACGADYDCAFGVCKNITCECDSGYYGKKCEGACPGLDAGSICSGHGNCTDGATGNGACECMNGYYGTDCSNECLPSADNPCSGHGTCDGISGECTCDDGWGGYDCGVATPSYEICDGVYEISDSTGTFWSNYAGLEDYYTNNLACEWRIVPGGDLAEIGGSITLDFTSFSLESYYDFLYVWDDVDKCNEIAVLDNTDVNSATGVPDSVTSDTGVMIVRFVSDYTVAYTGFMATYTVDPNVCDVDFDCLNNATCVDSLCQCTANLWGANCGKECPGGISTPCSGHGACDDGPLGMGTCSCDEGWGGPACSTECICIHGVCDAASALCKCDVGYGGSDCTEIIQDFPYIGADFFEEDSIDFKFTTRLQAVNFENTLFLIGDAMIERTEDETELQPNDVGGNYVYTVCLQEDGCESMTWRLRTGEGIWGDQLQYSRIGFGVALVEDKLLLLGGYYVAPRSGDAAATGVDGDGEDCNSGCPWYWIGDSICDSACNVDACDYDGGDCDSGYCAPGCPTWWVGDGICDSSSCFLYEECDYDGGDCGGNENECATDCEELMVGDGLCDPTCMTAECSYDNGDCDNIPFCSEFCPSSYTGDDSCISFCNVAACEYDGGDCEGILEPGYCLPGCSWDQVGDGICDPSCAVFECMNDGDDCTVGIQGGDVEVLVEFTVDYYYWEASWNIMRSDGSYYFLENQVFTASYEVVTVSVDLSSDDWEVILHDSYGDGGISGTLTQVSTGEILLDIPTSWYSQTTYEFSLVVVVCDSTCDANTLGDGRCDGSCNVLSCEYDQGDCSMEYTIITEVDYWYSEGSWNLQFEDGSYYYSSDQTFTSPYQQISTTLSLAPGAWELTVWDSYGDGGISVQVIDEFSGDVVVSESSSAFDSSGSYPFVASRMLEVHITVGNSLGAESSGTFALYAHTTDCVTELTTISGLVSPGTTYSFYVPTPATLGEVTGLQFISGGTDAVLVEAFEIRIPDGPQNMTVWSEIVGAWLDGRPFEDPSTYDAAYASEFHFFEDTFCAPDGTVGHCEGPSVTISLDVLDETDFMLEGRFVGTGGSCTVPLRNLVTGLGTDSVTYYEREFKVNVSTLVGLELIATSTNDVVAQMFTAEIDSVDGAVHYDVYMEEFALDNSISDANADLRAARIFFGLGSAIDTLCVDSSSDSGAAFCVNECENDPCETGTCYDLPESYGCASYAIGGSSYDDVGGAAVTFSDVVITLSVDYWYYEGSWNLYYSDGSPVFTSSQTFPYSYASTTTTVTLEGGFYEIQLYDSYGDGGISGTVMVDGVEVLYISSQSYSTASYSFFFGSGECAAGCDLSMVGDGVCDTACLTDACNNDDGDCIVDVDVYVYVDYYYYEASWNLRETGGDYWGSSGYLYSSWQTFYYGYHSYTTTVSLSPGEYQVVLADSWGDGGIYCTVTNSQTGALLGSMSSYGYATEGRITFDVSVGGGIRRRMLDVLEARRPGWFHPPADNADSRRRPPLDRVPPSGARHLSQCGAAETFEDSGCGFSSTKIQNDVWKVSDLRVDGDLSVQMVLSCAPWDARFDFATMVRDGTVFVCGGAREGAIDSTEFESSELFSDCWKSDDRGETWGLLVTIAEWEPRYRMMSAVHNNMLWIAGGEHTPKDGVRSLFEDIWWSGTGATWTKVTQSSALGPRSGAGMVSYNGYLYSLAGFKANEGDDAETNPVVLSNEVLRSHDGVSWAVATSEAEFEPRANGPALEHNGKLFFVGGVALANEGGFEEDQTYADVWVSAYPTISVFPSDVVISVVKPATTLVEIAIINSGSASLTWSLGNETTSWVTGTTPDGSIIPAAEYAEVTIYLDPSSLEPTLHTGSLMILSDDQDLTELTLPIEFTVEALLDVNVTHVAGDGISGCVAGDRGQVLVHARDADGFPVSTLLQDVYVTLREPSTGEAVSAPSLRLVDSGTFEAHYTTTIAGTYNLEVMADTDHIQGSPFTVSILSGETDGTQSTVEHDIPAEVDAGTTVTMLIVTLDQYGNVHDEPEDVDGFLVYVTGSVLMMLEKDDVVSLGDGEYIVSYSTSTAGQYNNVVRYRGDQLQGGSFTFTVLPTNASAEHSVVMDCPVGSECLVCSPGELCVSGISAGESHAVELWARDSYENMRKEPDIASFVIANGTEWVEVLLSDEGVYDLPLYYELVGTYPVYVMLNQESVTLASGFLIEVTAGQVSELSEVVGCVKSEVCVTLEPDAPQTLTVVTKDTFGNLRTTSGGSLLYRYNSGNLFSGIDKNDGTYTFEISQQIAGTYEIEIYIDTLDHDVYLSTSPFYLSLIAGPPDAYNSIAAFGGETCAVGQICGPEIVAGSNVSMVVHAFDMYGNQRYTASGAVCLADGGGMMYMGNEQVDGTFEISTGGTLTKKTGPSGTMMQISLNGAYVGNSAFMVVIIAATPLASKSTVMYIDDGGSSHSCMRDMQCGNDLEAGTSLPYLVVVSDSYDNSIDPGSATATVTYEVEGSGEGAVSVPALDEGFIFELIKTTVGVYSVKVRLFDEEIVNSPYTVSVVSGPTSTNTTTVSSCSGNVCRLCVVNEACIEAAEAGVAQSLLLVTRDVYENARTSSALGAFQLFVNEIDEGVGSYAGNGEYDFSYAVTIAGSHRLDVYFVGATMEVISNSPTYMTVVPSAASASQSNVFVEDELCESDSECGPIAVAGETQHLRLITRDAYGNLRNESSMLPVVAEVNSQLFSATDLHDGEYLAAITLTTSMSYDVLVQLGMDDVLEFKKTVVPAPPSPSQSTAMLAMHGETTTCMQSFQCGESITAGDFTTTYILVQDEFGNQITEDAGTITWGIDNVNGTAVFSADDEMYVFSVQLSEAQDYIIKIYLGGAEIYNSPFHLDVVSGPTVASQSSVESCIGDVCVPCESSVVCAVDIAAGSTAELRIVTRDEFGNERSDASIGTFEVSVSSGTATSFVSWVSGSGLYSASVVEVTAGTHTVSVAYLSSGAEDPVGGDEFLLQVIPSVASATTSTTSVNGTRCISGVSCVADGIVAGASTFLSVQTYDAYGNIRSESAGVPLLVDVDGVMFATADVGDGTYTSEITLTAVQDDEYVVSVKLGSDPVGDSGFLLSVVPGAASAANAIVATGISDPIVCESNADCGEAVLAGLAKEFAVAIHDSFGNRITEDVAEVHAVVGTTVIPTTYVTTGAVYKFEVFDTIAGSLEVEVLLGGESTSSSPFLSTIVPGPTDATSCFVEYCSDASCVPCVHGEACASEIVAGSTVSLRIITRDEFGNDKAEASSGSFSVISSAGTSASSISWESSTGTYSVSFAETLAGSHSVVVSYQSGATSVEVEGSGFLLEIVPATASSSTSQAYLADALCVSGLECMDSGLEAGSSTTLTVQTYDAYGNLRSSSAGVPMLVDVDGQMFSTSDMGDGTYTSAMILTKANDVAYTVSVSLGNDELGSSGFLAAVVPGPPSAAHSIVFDEDDISCVQDMTCGAAVDAGASHRFFVALRDEFDNRIPDDVTTVLYRVGSGAEDVAALYNDLSGEYEFDVVLTLASSYQVFVAVGDEDTPYSPFLVEVVAGPTNPSSSSIQYCPSSNNCGDYLNSTSCVSNVDAGASISFRIVTRDAFGNERSSASSGYFAFSVSGSTATSSVVWESGSGIYTASVLETVAGSHTVSVSYTTAGSSTDVDGSGFLLDVIPSTASADTSVAEIDGTTCVSGAGCVEDGVVAGDIVELLVHTYDPYGNKRSWSAGTPLIVDVEGQLLATVDEGDGTYSCAIVLTEVRTDAYAVSVSLGSDELRSSGFTVSVVPGTPSAEASVVSTVDGNDNIECTTGVACGEDLVAGVDRVFSVGLRDEYGNPIPSDVSSVTFRLEDNSLGQAVFDSSTAAYRFSVSRTASGVYDVHTFVDNVSVSGSPFQVDVIPDLTDATMSTVERCDGSGTCLPCEEGALCASGVVAGSALSLQIVTRDEYGNLRSDASSGSFAVSVSSGTASV
eukprot:Rmarinus@m.29416